METLHPREVVKYTSNKAADETAQQRVIGVFCAFLLSSGSEMLNINTVPVLTERIYV